MGSLALAAGPAVGWWPCTPACATTRAPAARALLAGLALIPERLQRLSTIHAWREQSEGSGVAPLVAERPQGCVDQPVIDLLDDELAAVLGCSCPQRLFEFGGVHVPSVPSRVAGIEPLSRPTPRRTPVLGWDDGLPVQQSQGVRRALFALFRIDGRRLGVSPPSSGIR